MSRVHYGRRGLRASCGRRHSKHLSRLKHRVTCIRCKETLQWRHDWWDQPKEEAS